MVDNAAVSPVAEAPKTEKQLLAELQKALATGDFKVVAKVSQELVKFQKTKEAAEQETRVKALGEMTGKVQQVITKSLQKMYDDGALDKADGVWFTWDFGEKLTTCRLMKATTKAPRAGGGGGGGKKFSVSTTDLLEKFGGQEYKDGQSFKQAWEADADKNKRYAIREALLKKEGLIS